MESYKILFKKSVLKDFKTVPEKEVHRILDAIKSGLKIRDLLNQKSYQDKINIDCVKETTESYIR